MADRNFLSAFIKEDIYLIDRSGSKPAKQSLDAEKYLIVTPGPLSDTDREFLYKIFAAVQVPPQQLFIADEKLSPEDFKAAFYFGIEPNHASVYYRKQLVQQKPQIMAHPLSEIARDNGRKRKLWAVLKELFG